MLTTLAAVVRTVRRLVLAPSRRPCRRTWTDAEHRRDDPHRCGLRRGHAGTCECRIQTDTGVCLAHPRKKHCQNTTGLLRQAHNGDKPC